MTIVRYFELKTNIESELTQEEVEQGWYFCKEFDGMLLNSNDPQYTDICICDK